MADELDTMDDQKNEAPQRDAGGIKLSASATVVSAIVGAITAFATSQATTPDASNLADKVRAEIVREADARYVIRGVDDTRWQYYSQGVDDRLKTIVEKLEAIDRRTADLPRMAAKLEMLERASGK